MICFKYILNFRPNPQKPCIAFGRGRFLMKNDHFQFSSKTYHLKALFTLITMVQVPASYDQPS